MKKILNTPVTDEDLKDIKIGDVIYLNGYGFPAYRGGPMFYAEQIGLEKVLARIREFHAQHGAWWKPAALLEKLVAEGRTFSDWNAGK